MTADPFSTASEAEAEAPSGSDFQAKDHVGDVLLITPTKYNEHVKTKFNDDADVVVADVVVIKPDVAACEKSEEVWFLQGRLIRKLKGKVGAGMVLGKLIQEPTDKGNPAYDLEDPSEGAKDAARAYLAANQPEPPF